MEHKNNWISLPHKFIPMVNLMPVAIIYCCALLPILIWSLKIQSEQNEWKSHPDILFEGSSITAYLPSDECSVCSPSQCKNSVSHSLCVVLMPSSTAENFRVLSLKITLCHRWWFTAHTRRDLVMCKCFLFCDQMSGRGRGTFHLVSSQV